MQRHAHLTLLPTLLWLNSTSAFTEAAFAVCHAAPRAFSLSSNRRRRGCAGSAPSRMQRMAPSAVKSDAALPSFACIAEAGCDAGHSAVRSLPFPHKVCGRGLTDLALPSCHILLGRRTGVNAGLGSYSRCAWLTLCGWHRLPGENLRS